ncbi:MAG TPA: ribonuclease HI family protein [Candidatus Polarisedimenticolaceae bacterium]|nr:ribonuclease HI family protein [Candidatus Polarisedimenticolaceae bacterium]
MAERFRAAIDGGSRGNPGPAAWGVAVLGPDGEPAEGYAGYLGRATNNVAEYRALIEALELAIGRGADDVELLADSELVVRQIQGSYRVRNETLKPLFAEAMRRIRAIPRFRIVHVRREQNTAADRLVNLALDRAEADPEAGTARIVEVGSGG